jgi:hypothetical protein
MGQAELNRQNKTARTGLPGQGCQDRAACTGLPGKGCPDRAVQIGCQHMTVRIGLL